MNWQAVAKNLREQANEGYSFAEQNMDELEYHLYSEICSISRILDGLARALEEGLKDGN